MEYTRQWTQYWCTDISNIEQSWINDAMQCCISRLDLTHRERMCERERESGGDYHLVHESSIWEWVIDWKVTRQVLQQFNDLGKIKLPRSLKLNYLDHKTII